MPRGDRRGPDGLGPMSGRRAGYCAGFPVPGFLNSFLGRFRGGGYGCGAYARGRRWAGFFSPVGPIGLVDPYAGNYGGYDPSLEAETLAREADYLKQQLGAIESRLAQLEKGKKESLGGNQD